MSTRVYQPFSLPALRDLAEATGTTVPEVRAYAVTAALRAEYPGADDEELEYVAMTLAARASTARLRAHDLPRRLVVAWDAEQVSEVADGPFEVRVSGLRFPRDVASYHLDGPAAEPDVARARDAWVSGDRDAWEDAAARADRHDLGWWATQELPAVLEQERSRR